MRDSALLRVSIKLCALLLKDCTWMMCLMLTDVAIKN